VSRPRLRDCAPREKRAVLGLLAHGGIAAAMTAGGHLGTNRAGLVAHHASNIAEVLAHKGWNTGLLEQGLNPDRAQALKAMFGPEALIPYELANEAAKKLVTKFPNPVERATAIREALHQYQATGLTNHAPGVGHLMSAMEHDLKGTTPTLSAKGRLASWYSKAVDKLTNHVRTGFETPSQSVGNAFLGAAPLAPMLAADTALTGSPLGALGHFGWNATRNIAGNTSLGEKFVGEQLAKGLRGDVPGKFQTALFNYGLSPAVLEPRMLGKAIHDLPKGQKFIARARAAPGALAQSLPVQAARVRDAEQRAAFELAGKQHQLDDAHNAVQAQYAHLRGKAHEIGALPGSPAARLAETEILARAPLAASQVATYDAQQRLRASAGKAQQGLATVANEATAFGNSMPGRTLKHTEQALAKYEAADQNRIKVRVLTGQPSAHAADGSF